MPLVVYKPYYQRNWSSARRLPPVRGGHYRPSTLLCRKATVYGVVTRRDRGQGLRPALLVTARPMPRVRDVPLSCRWLFSPDAGTVSLYLSCLCSVRDSGFKPGKQGRNPDTGCRRICGICAVGCLMRCAMYYICRLQAQQCSRQLRSCHRCIAVRKETHQWLLLTISYTRELSLWLPSSQGL
jgi:hypothetical protein